jgi:hypothetical protein
MAPEAPLTFYGAASSRSQRAFIPPFILTFLLHMKGVKIRQAEHLDMRFELIVLMIVILSWMRDLPADLYPGAPPSVQIRGKPATDPLNRGIS